MSYFRPPEWKIAIAKRLGVDWELLGQGNGAIWAWTKCFTLFGWTVHAERFIRREFEEVL